jgi:hydrogenase maturation protease
VRVIGVGNRWRGDDAAGLEVAGLVRGMLPDAVEVLQREGEPIDLIDAWQDADAVWVADAVSSGAQAGVLYRLDVHDHELPVELFRGSTHHLGLADAVELARTLDRLPPRAVVYGVEAASFEPGQGLSPAVRDGVQEAARRISAEVSRCLDGRPG